MLPFISHFVAPDGTLLPAFNPLFYSVQGNLVIASNAACGTSSGSVVDVVGINEVFSPNQFVEGTVAFLGGVSYAGLALRCGAPGSGNAYWWISTVASMGSAFLGLIAGGVFATLATLPAFAAGDFIRAEMDGININLRVNGVSIGIFSDATYAAGAAGLAAFRDDLQSGMADVRAGDLRPVPAASLFMPAFVGGL